MRPDYNFPLLRKTLEHIEAHPDEHNQQNWGEVTPCGTTFCFAGHALNLVGAELIWSERPWWYPPNVEHSPDLEFAILPGGGEKMRPRLAAQEALGLTETQAETLFFDKKTLKGVRTYVNTILAKET